MMDLDHLPWFGFTDDEVIYLANVYGMDFEKMRDLYAGYIGKDYPLIYCPYSIIQSIMYRQYGPFWCRSATYQALRRYLTLPIEGLYSDIAVLLKGEPVWVDAHSKSIDILNPQHKNDVCGLLIHLGYLTYDSTTSSAFIPNQEIQNEFQLVLSTINAHCDK